MPTVLGFAHALANDLRGATALAVARLLLAPACRSRTSQQTDRRPRRLPNPPPAGRRRLRRPRPRPLPVARRAGAGPCAGEARTSPERDDHRSDPAAVRPAAPRRAPRTRSSSSPRRIPDNPPCAARSSPSESSRPAIPDRLHDERPATCPFQGGASTATRAVGARPNRTAIRSRAAKATSFAISPKVQVGRAGVNISLEPLQRSDESARGQRAPRPVWPPGGLPPGHP